MTIESQRSEDAWKARLRSEARKRRQSVPDPDQRSRRIMARMRSLPEFQQARWVLFYVSARTEVRTIETLDQLLRTDKRLAVPYCQGEELELFALRSLDELRGGRFGILEPAEQLRNAEDRRVALEQLDVAVVPGLAFDRRGGRIGYGKGFYDRLLQRAAPHTLRVAPAFECQLFERIPMDPHDVRVQRVVTESAVHEAGPAD